MESYYRPFLKALSAICGNIAAAWFAIPLIGSSIGFPRSPRDWFVLTLDIGFGTVFLLITMWVERKLEHE